MASKVEEIMNARSQGMKMALKMVETGGVEVLREEIKYRGIIGLSTANSKAEMTHVLRLMQEKSTRTAMAIALETLIDDFGFGKTESWQFKKAFDEKVDGILINGGDITKTLMKLQKEIGMVITFD